MATLTAHNIADLPTVRQQLAQIIWDTAAEVLGEEPYTGGCTPFADPETWNDDYGTNSELVVIHDGGDLAPILNLDYGNYELYDKFRQKLEAKGYWVEQCTSWYSAVYKNFTANQPKEATP